MKIPKYSCGSDDITFCASTCDDRTCYRHPSNIIHRDIPHSFAPLKNTTHCPLYHDYYKYPCKWYAQWEGVCTNGECPFCADICPVTGNQTVCRFMEEES